MTRKGAPGCRGECNQGRSDCRTPAVCLGRPEAKESALDSLIMPMGFSDTKDHEKGPMFSPRGARILVGSAVAIVLTALAFALA